MVPAKNILHNYNKQTSRNLAIILKYELCALLGKKKKNSVLFLLSLMITSHNIKNKTNYSNAKTSVRQNVRLSKFLRYMQKCSFNLLAIATSILR